jgi:cysteine desulfurase/selenocysteine lyase
MDDAAMVDDATTGRATAAAGGRVGAGSVAVAATTAAGRAFDPETIRADFPPLSREVRPGVPLTYLDSAATALKPRVVLDALAAYNGEYPANVHRGLHALSERATEAFEGAREGVARFLNAPESEEVVFTRGTTESINLVALAWGRANLKPGDEILLSAQEHHSNLVPWQLAAKATGATLVFADVRDDGTLDVDSARRLLKSGRVKMLPVTGMSNVTGAIPPVAELARLAHEHGSLILVDAAQSLPHGPADVRALDVDFLAFSGHKLCGPTGVGVLWGKRPLLEAMPPLFGGGSMVLRVGLTDADWNDVPWKFEAGTPPIAEAIALGAALDYLAPLDWPAIRRHERALAERAHARLRELPGIRIVGPEPARKGGIVSFTSEGVHPHDLAQLADREGVAIRAGHHCAMPLHERLGLTATARASFLLYNTPEDADRLAHAIASAQRLFGIKATH